MKKFFSRRFFEALNTNMKFAQKKYDGFTTKIAKKTSKFRSFFTLYLYLENYVFLHKKLRVTKFPTKCTHYLQFLD